MFRKLQDRRGLTMVEMLCATVILLLLGMMINVGLHMAMQSYQEMVLKSETKLLLSTLSDVLTDELRYAADVTTDAAGKVSFRSARYGGSTSIAVDTAADSATKGKVMVSTGGGSYRLLPDGAYGRGDWKYEVKEAAITFAEDTDLFTVMLKIGEKGSAADVPAEVQFSVRCLNP